MNLSQETIDKKFSLPKTTNKNSRNKKTIGCFTETIGCLYQLILPVDRSVGACLVTGSTCAPLQTSVPLQDRPREPAKEQSGAAAADRTPTPKSVAESPNTKRTRTVQILSHSVL